MMKKIMSMCDFIFDILRRYKVWNIQYNTILFFEVKVCSIGDLYLLR